MTATQTDDSIESRTRSKSIIISKLWSKLNDALEYTPKFQNKSISGVDDETIQRIESKLKITLLKEIRDVVKVHDERDHIGYGFSYRLATTDLLPISQWRPYEKESESYPDMLFGCLTDENDGSYIDGVNNADQLSKNKRTKTNYTLDNDEAFYGLPCELLVIGEGADDYVEQYLLSIRSGRIYLAIHNIPEWKLIGTFANWIKMGVQNAVDDQKDIQTDHDGI